jgi:cell division septum initiation protein DivIVA
VLAWLYADDLKAALAAEIDAIADDATALTPDKRRAREAELKGQILAAERMEEALIESAEEAGSEILRRADADFRAVLGLSDDTPAPRT